MSDPPVVHHDRLAHDLSPESLPIPLERLPRPAYRQVGQGTGGRECGHGATPDTPGCGDPMRAQRLEVRRKLGTSTSEYTDS